MSIPQLSLTKKAPQGDLLLSGLTIVSAISSVQLDGAIAIQAGRISAIGPSAVVRAQRPQLAEYDGRGYTAMPGLVNAHTHAAMGFFRGLGHGQDEMIETFFFPAEKALTAELIEPLAYSYLYGGMLSGSTTFGDHYYHVAGVAKAIDRLGLRGVVGETVADLGGAFPGRTGWESWQRTIANWPFSSRLSPSIAPHAADTVSPSLLQELASYARAHSLPLHMHLSQSSGERLRVLQREGCTPVAYAERCGALTDRTLAVHLVTVDEDDLYILKRSGVTAGHCPASQIIYERLAPLEGFLKHQIPVALGTDCAASNDSADLIAEMRLTALLAADRNVPLEQRTPQAILRMGSLNGAQALGLGDEVGALEPGRAADFVLLANDLTTEPAQRPEVNVIFSHASRNVRHVMVDGRFVLFQGEPTQMSVSDMREAYLEAVAAIYHRLGR